MLIQALIAAIPVLVAVFLAFRNKIRALLGKPPIESRRKDAAVAVKGKDDDFEEIDE
jgi:hypothetical protein